MKKILILLMAVILFIIGCGKNAKEKEKVEKVFKENMKIVQSGNMYDYTDIFPSKLVARKSLFEEGYKKITYKLNKIEIDKSGEIAIVNATVKIPDISQYKEEYSKKLTPMMFTNRRIDRAEQEQLLNNIYEEATKFFNDKFSQPDLKFKEITVNVNYKKESGYWVINRESNDDFYKILDVGIEDMFNGTIGN